MNLKLSKPGRNILNISKREHCSPLHWQSWLNVYWWHRAPISKHVLSNIYVRVEIEIEFCVLTLFKQCITCVHMHVGQWTGACTPMYEDILIPLCCLLELNWAKMLFCCRVEILKDVYPVFVFPVFLASYPLASSSCPFTVIAHSSTSHVLLWSWREDLKLKIDIFLSKVFTPFKVYMGI